jgi:two-component system, sensor histidine kinase PdtaS
MAKRRGTRPGDETVDHLRDYHATIAAVGRLALSDLELDDLLQTVTEKVAATVGLRYVKILEYQPETNDLLVKAGVGWKPGVIGHARMSTELSSPPGRAFQTNQPVTVQNLPENQEFRWSDLLREHSVVSLLNVPLNTETATYGVLEIDATRADRISDDARNFLLAVAALLGPAIERRRAEEIARSATVAAATAASERELLLRELNHRVGNNLQALLGLIHTSRRKAEAAEPGVFDLLIQRVNAMIDSHLQLSADEKGQRIELGGYLISLSHRLLKPYPRIRLESEIGQAEIGLGRAVRVGLIVNEIITNAVKHAFPGDAGGIVRVEFKADVGRGEGRVVVADDGRGIGARPRSGQGLGLVASLANQIGGTIERSDMPGGGTRYEMRFPLTTA